MYKKSINFYPKQTRLLDFNLDLISNFQMNRYDIFPENISQQQQQEQEQKVKL